MTTVLVVDDHAVFAETLAQVLAANPDLSVIGPAMTGREAIDRARQDRPDVALLDIGLPDISGIEAAAQIRAASPTTRVVMLTGDPDPALFPLAMGAGACGYLLKDAGIAEVVEAIRHAAEGEVVVPPSVAERMMRPARAPERGLGSDLTPRELEVLQHLAAGGDAKSIGKALGITWHTARSYIRDVRQKLGAQTVLEAVMTALKLGIIEQEGA